MSISTKAKTPSLLLEGKLGGSHCSPTYPPPCAVRPCVQGQLMNRVSRSNTETPLADTLTTSQHYVMFPTITAQVLFHRQLAFPGNELLVRIDSPIPFSFQGCFPNECTTLITIRKKILKGLHSIEKMFMKRKKNSIGRRKRMRKWRNEGKSAF